MTRSSPALNDAAASAVVDSGRPSGSRGRATGWWPPTQRPSSSRLGSGATASSTLVASATAWPRISGTAVDSHSSPRRSAPSVQTGASQVPAESTSRPDSVGTPCRPTPRWPGRRRHARRQVIEQRVAQLAHVVARTGAVHHPPDVAPGAVGEGDPQPASRERLGVQHLGRGDPQPSGRTQRVQQRPADRRHAVAQCVPRPGVLGQEARPVALVEPAPQLGHPEPQPVHRRTPVPRRPADLVHMSVGPRHDVVEAGPPVGDVGDRGQLRPRQVGPRQSPGSRDAEHPAVQAAALPRQRDDDVDHGQAGPHHQHVGRPDVVPSYDVERAGCPRVRHEEGRLAQAPRRPGTTPPAADPWRRRPRRRRVTAPERATDRPPSGRASHRDRLVADVAAP